MIEIYDNLIPVEQQAFVEDAMTDGAFPWYLTKATVEEKNYEYLNSYLPKELWKDYQVKEYPQFIHMFYTIEKQACSPAYSSIAVPLFEKLKQHIVFNEFLRVKANLQTQCNFSKEEFTNMPHLDCLIDHKVALYYVNDSDGDTLFFNNDGSILKRVSPKRGRFVIFNGSQFHAGRHPNQSEKRVVINFDYR